jgi:hypothetical protein
MIGPGGLLLVVPHLFALPVSVLLVGLQKSTELNLDVKNIFSGSHTQHRWRCSKTQELKKPSRVWVLEPWALSFIEEKNLKSFESDTQNLKYCIADVKTFFTQKKVFSSIKGAVLIHSKSTSCRSRVGFHQNLNLNLISVILQLKWNGLPNIRLLWQLWHQLNYL